MSILWIMVFHVFFLLGAHLGKEQYIAMLREAPAYMYWIWNADKAVDAFFMISGFLIAGLLFQERDTNSRIRFKRFYWWRFLRLTPVYLFAIVLFYLTTEHNRDNLWANLFYINNFLPFDQMAMEWTWSLAVEEQFYIIFPLFLSLALIRGQQTIFWLILLLIASCLIRFMVAFSNSDLWNASFSEILDPKGLMNEYMDSLYVNLYTRFGPFVAGILLAYLNLYHKTQMLKVVVSPFGKALTFLAIAMVLFLSFAPVFHPDVYWPQWFVQLYMVFNRTLFGLALAWMALIALYSLGIGKWISKLLASRFWYPFAQLSYSMYLFHVAAIVMVLFNVQVNMDARGLVFAELSFWQLLSLMLVVTPITLLIAILTYLLIERPFMNLRRISRKPEIRYSPASLTEKIQAT
ncbi:MAG: acyltransferase [Pseudomonadales bacterium]|nr:acyltransferase [Pseudomonadales bacterium]